MTDYNGLKHNIFELPNPDDSLCEIEAYADTHKTLNIRVTNDRVSGTHLLFGRVAYYCGSTSWKGANFRFASKDEYIEFIKESNLKIDNTDDLILYVATLNNIILSKILALYGQKTDSEGIHAAARPENVK